MRTKKTQKKPSKAFMKTLNKVAPKPHKAELDMKAVGPFGEMTEISPDQLPDGAIFELLKQFTSPKRGIAVMLFNQEQGTSTDLFYMNLSVKDLSWIGTMANAYALKEVTKQREERKKKKSCAQDFTEKHQ